MFRGNHLYAVDDKGRVAIPARFRDELSVLQDTRLVVSRFRWRMHRCLDVYPISAWQKIEDKIAAARQFGNKAAVFQRFYVGAAQDSQVDAQGRILIPPTLRAWAAIGREVMFVGATDKFHIFDKDVFHEIDREDEHQVFDDPDFLDQLGL